MADLGDLIGSLMSGVIRARRVADEQTAALAEYYKDNPLLEGLSVPRVRISELTIDLPFLIEGQVEGEAGKMESPSKIASAAETQLKSTASQNDIKIAPAFYKTFSAAVKEELSSVKLAGAPVMKEALARSVQDAFAAALTKTKTPLSASEKAVIARDLRTKISSVGITKAPVTPSIESNIKTADVKEKATGSSVVRLTITIKEEGLEWSTRADESGGVVRTLQPE